MFVISLERDDVMKWKHFPRYEGQCRAGFMFSFICAWTDGWANNRDAGDLRHHLPHYDVIVMKLYAIPSLSWTYPRRGRSTVDDRARVPRQMPGCWCFHTGRQLQRCQPDTLGPYALSLACRISRKLCPFLVWRKSPKTISSTHLPIYASVNQVSIGSDSGLALIRRQAIIWTNTGSLPVVPVRTNFSDF